MKQVDLDAGQVENRAKVVGMPLVGPVAEDFSGNNSLTDDTPTVVPLIGTPAIAVVKTASPTSINPAQAGDNAGYAVFGRVTRGMGGRTQATHCQATPDTGGNI